MAKQDGGDWMVKAPRILKPRLDDLIRKRIMNNKDKRPTNYRRLLLALARDDVTLTRLANADFIDGGEK